MSELTIYDPKQAITLVTALADTIRALRADVFKKDVDYGVIPGTGDKPTLLLPGMEKLLRALRLIPRYVPLTIVEDFGKPFFHYRYECQLVEQESGVIVATAIGSANSYEGKWRWRDQKRTCPKCGKETINKSKTKPEWYCWAKLGGCGATFPENDPQIAGQATGRVENPDIFDQVNTIDKIAQKRALSSAIKGAANVSEYFTVDLEDIRDFGNVVEGDFEEVVHVAPAQPKAQPKGGVIAAGVVTDVAAFDAAVNKLHKQTVEGEPDALDIFVKEASSASAPVISQLDGEYTPKDVQYGRTDVPETSFLHKANIGKLKARVQNIYADGAGKINTFHINGSICKMLNLKQLTVSMDVDQAERVVLNAKAPSLAPTGTDGKPAEDIPF